MHNSPDQERLASVAWNFCSGKFMIAVDSGRLQLAGSGPECHNNKLGAIPQFNYNQITALTGPSKTSNLKKCKDNQLIRSSSPLNE